MDGKVTYRRRSDGGACPPAFLLCRALGSCSPSQSVLTALSV